MHVSDDATRMRLYFMHGTLEPTSNVGPRDASIEAEVRDGPATERT